MKFEIKNLNRAAVSLLSALLMLLALISASSYAKSTELASMRVAEQATKTRVVFDFSQLPNYKIQTLASPNRLVIDFDKTENLLSFKKKFLRDDARLFSIQVQNTSQDTRIVLGLHKLLNVKAFTLGKNSSGHERLVVDLLDERVTSQAHSNKDSAKKVTRTVNPQQAKATSKTITKSIVKTEKPPLFANSPPHFEPTPFHNTGVSTKPIVVAIDAGHGGKDSGAIGVGGIYEKHVTLAVAKRLQKLINQQANMRAVMIRDRDVFIPLKERVNLAKHQKADIFISIHADAFHDKRVKGGTVYVLSEKGASSEMAKLIAQSENASLQQVNLGEVDNDVLYALSDMSREANVNVSRKLAKNVLGEMQKTVKMHKASVQSANFAVLKTLDMPALLIETAFISNPTEAKNLQNPKFQEKVASAIAKGLNQFVGTYASKPRWGEQLYVHYRVKSGDTLSEIADQYNVSVADLKRINQIRNPNQLIKGKIVKIPVSESVLAGV